MLNATQAVKRVLSDKFGKNNMEYIKVYSGKSDPGEWSPGALAVVHGAPGVETMNFDLWLDLGKQVEAAYGKPCYFEFVNSCVVALHRICY